jgi:ribosomal protein S6
MPWSIIGVPLISFILRTLHKYVYLMEENMQNDGPLRRVYELGYLLVPSITEENVAGEATALKDIILSFGALPISEEYPKLMGLAYDMEAVINNKKEHFETGYFGWFKFELAPEQLALLESKLKLSDKLIRFLLIKTVRESTMASKRPFGRDFKRRTDAKRDPTAPPVEINKEEIDKQIEALISDEASPVPEASEAEA